MEPLHSKNVLSFICIIWLLMMQNRDKRDGAKIKLWLFDDSWRFNIQNQEKLVHDFYLALH